MPLYLHILGIHIHVTSDIGDTPLALLRQNYSQLTRDSFDEHSTNTLHYQIKAAEHLFAILCTPDNQRIECEKPSQFIYFFEKNLTIQLQKQHSHLLFLHAATLTHQQQAFLIIGQSGAGKSTTTWALTHHGFGYSSDELSPIDLEQMTVAPYPHAICLKRPPPAPYTLPNATLKTDYTMHIPVDYLSSGVNHQPVPVKHIFFVQYDVNQENVLIEPISAANATMQIYTSVGCTNRAY